MQLQGVAFEKWVHFRLNAESGKESKLRFGQSRAKILVKPEMRKSDFGKKADFHMD
jgi:hypothetical protein